MSWNLTQKLVVRAAIIAVARRNRMFTADDVWRYLGDAIPVTKGLASQFTMMVRDGVIENTGATAITRRPGGKHNHGQRLTVWRSRVYQGV